MDTLTATPHLLLVAAFIHTPAFLLSGAIPRTIQFAVAYQEAQNESHQNQKATPSMSSRSAVALLHPSSIYSSHSITLAQAIFCFGVLLF